MDALDAAGAWGGIPGTPQIIRTSWKYVHHANEGEQTPETAWRGFADFEISVSQRRSEEHMSNGRRGGKSVPRHGQLDVQNILSEIIESHLSAPPATQSSESATLGGLDASAYVPYANADKNVDLNGHNITGNSDAALSTPGDDTAVPSQKAVKT